MNKSLMVKECSIPVTERRLNVNTILEELSKSSTGCVAIEGFEDYYSSPVSFAITLKKTLKQYGANVGVCAKDKKISVFDKNRVEHNLFINITSREDAGTDIAKKVDKKYYTKLLKRITESGIMGNEQVCISRPGTNPVTIYKGLLRAVLSSGCKVKVEMKDDKVFVSKAA